MNTALKNLIIDNEIRLLKRFPEYKFSINQFIRKIESINHDAILFDFIMSHWNILDKNKKKKEDTYNRFGFKSARQIINENKKEIDFNDRLFLDKLNVDNLYSSLEICSLADNYNNQVGMYYLTGIDSVIIKSTVLDNDRPYDDKWLKPGIILRYFMQKESESNVNSFIFSNRPNSAIFNSLMEHGNINIYVFINEEKGKPYKYKGIFHPCGLVQNNKAFLLFKEGYENDIPFDNLDGQFIMPLIYNGSFNSVFLDDLTLSLGSSEENLFAPLKNISIISKRNYLQNLKIDLEVALRGETLVLNREREKLKKLGRNELAELVENISIDNINLGYDIKSFDIDKNGNVKELFIKVKTFVCNRSGNHICISEKEFNNLKSNGNYKLFNVYDIYTDCPKYFEISLLSFNPIPQTFSLERR